MNGIIVLALICSGAVLISLLTLFLEWVGNQPKVREVVDKILETLPLMW